jgi:ABC-type phosphate/phosphonate transport system substrate-binding protein
MDMRTRSIAVALGAVLALFGSGSRADDSPGARSKERTPLKIGAVAYAPGSVTVFEGIRRYCGKNGLAVDYVLYSNYDALVEALRKGQVDVAWNTPLAHARYHKLAGNASKTLVMREVDCGFRSKLIVRKDAGISSVSGLAGKTLVLGSRDAAEATVLPLHYLKGEGLDMAKVKVLSLDKEVDLKGNPCSSEVHVLKALEEGRGQAGIIGERLWERLKKEDPERVRGLDAIWTSTAFSHCVFTAGMDLDDGVARKFTALMTAMDPADPETAEVMKLEGTRRWVAGSPDGFRDLLKALDEGEDCGCESE